MDAKAWMTEIESAFHQQRKELTQELRDLLFEDIDPSTQSEMKFAAVEVTNVVNRFLWHKVVSQQTFGRIERVREKFGKTLEENYGLHDGPFLDLARAYWTFQIELQDLYPEYSRKWLSQTLQAVEQTPHTATRPDTFTSPPIAV